MIVHEIATLSESNMLQGCLLVCVSSQWMSMSQDTRLGHLQRIPMTGRAMDDTAITDTTTAYRDTGWHTSHSAIALLCHGFFHTSTLTPQWPDNVTWSSGSHFGGIVHALWSTWLTYLTNGNRKTTWTLTIDAILLLNYCQSSLSTRTHTHRQTG